MKVLIFNSRLEYMKNWGGDTTQIVETVKALNLLGVKTDLAMSKPKNVKECDLIHIFNLQTIDSALDLISMAKMERKPLVLSTIYWDLRYTSHEDNMKYCGGKLFELIAQVSPKLSMCLHEIRYYYGAQRGRNNQIKALNAVDIILPNSVAELEILVQQYNMPQLRGRSLIVPNAVSYEKDVADDIKPFNAGLPPQYVLMSASFHPIKGQHRLIEALNKNSEIPIVFVGRIDKESVYGRHCLKLAKQRGNTFIIGVVNHADMPTLYSHAKVHVLPSLRESPGLSSLEAAVYGANCVVSIHTPVWEYFRNEAFVCNPLDPSSIKASVIQAWHSMYRAELKKMILQEFTWAKAAEITCQAYERAIRHK